MTYAKLYLEQCPFRRLDVRSGLPIEHRFTLTRLPRLVPLPPQFVGSDEIHRCPKRRWVRFRSHSPFSLESPPSSSYFYDNTMSQLTQLPIERLRRHVGRPCSFEAGYVYLIHLLALVFPYVNVNLVSIDRNPPVPTLTYSKETYRPSYTQNQYLSSYQRLDRWYPP